MSSRPVEPLTAKIEREEVLVQNLASRVVPCHLYQALRTLEPDRLLSEIPERDEITPGTAAKVQNGVRPGIGKMTTERGDVLAHVVVPRSLPEGGRPFVVVLQRY